MASNAARTPERRQYPRTNEILAARVCVAIEEAVSHGKEIQVFADEGEVTLCGGARPVEMIDVLNAASSVRGVDRLHVHLETF